MADPQTLLWQALAHCGQVLQTEGGVLGALLLAGLLGSVSHCVGMCGPFVLAQVGARLERVPAAGMTEWHRLAGAAAAPYHLGRATTYAALGALGGGLAGGLATLPALRQLAASLLVLAAGMFLLGALRQVGLWPGQGTGGAAAPGWVGRVLGPLFAAPVGWRGYALGLGLGFLPCGLLYGALAAAASTGSALAGALGMAGFALGTVPALVATGMLGHLAARRFKALAGVVAPGLMMVNAAFLGWTAWGLASG
ncbi:MAG: sulfite exporter TauE/SafE family protein [Rhodospirillales bacterium]|nr:sulfite exporter TauE/SafE family protein [Rhodospirillales bacterium]